MCPNKTFEPVLFLHASGSDRKVRRTHREIIFFQGEPANAIFYLHEGRVKLSVLSADGKRAAIGLLGPGEFLGEESIASEQRAYAASAICLANCTVTRIERAEMLRALCTNTELTRVFVDHLLTRSHSLQQRAPGLHFQGLRKAARKGSAVLGKFRNTKPRDIRLQNQPGNIGGDSRHKQAARQLLHE